MTDGTKKSTYNPVAQKKYDQKRKKLLVQNYENTAWIKGYNKKYFWIVNFSGEIVKKF